MYRCSRPILGWFTQFDLPSVRTRRVFLFLRPPTYCLCGRQSQSTIQINIYYCTFITVVFNLEVSVWAKSSRVLKTKQSRSKVQEKWPKMLQQNYTAEDSPNTHRALLLLACQYTLNKCKSRGNWITFLACIIGLIWVKVCRWGCLQQNRIRKQLSQHCATKHEWAVLYLVEFNQSDVTEGS